MSYLFLPRYVCEKEVWAGKITAVCQRSLVLGGGVAVLPKEGFMEKHKPRAGGYYVRDTEGNEWFALAAAFDASYRRMT